MKVDILGVDMPVVVAIIIPLAAVDIIIIIMWAHLTHNKLNKQHPHNSNINSHNRSSNIRLLTLWMVQ